MNDFRLFLGKFLRQGTAIASIAPSSRWLSRAAVSNIDWQGAKVIVELGAGTGPITKVIAERANEDCQVVVLERDPDFADVLHRKFDRYANVKVIEGDVRNLGAILEDFGIAGVDHVISGLPVPSFPPTLQKDLMCMVGQVLKSDGTYNQITEFPLVYRSLYRRFFEDVRFLFEPRNLPPAGVYLCRGIREFTEIPC